MSTRFKHYVYYLEHLAQEFQFFQDDESDNVDHPQGSQGDGAKAPDKFLKHTYLYRCLMECKVTLSIVEEYIEIINAKILQVQELLDACDDELREEQDAGVKSGEDIVSSDNDK